MCSRKRGNVEIAIQQVALPLCLFGLVCLSVQVPLIQTYTPDIFESANAGILISDFLNFGKIPLIEHYGGHMMTGVWEGILYGVLNGDAWGASFSPYAAYIIPLNAILLYFIIKALWSEQMAFWSILLLPVLDDTGYFALGLLVVLAVVAFIRKPTFGRSLFMWLSGIWCALYRLDLGYSFLLACVFIVCVYIIKERRWSLIKLIFLPLAACMVLGCALWAVLCLSVGENPILRLVEFLKISASNQNWSYGTLGDTSKNAFAFCYVILPFLIAGTLCYSILFRDIKNRIGTVRWLILAMLGVAYFTNFSRGLVRHSVIEGTTIIAIWCGLLYLAVFCSCMINKKVLLPSFVALIILNQGIFDTSIFNQTILSNSISQKIQQSTQEWESDEWSSLALLDAPVKRVQASTETIQMFQPIQFITKLLLKENETFVDFANISFAYSYLQRECPVYVSQSPMQLSGEFTQEQFVDQISNNPEHNPIAIMPFNTDGHSLDSHLDGVSNAYRYYKVSEYIYSHYVPLCSVGNYAIWCLNERYDQYVAMIEDLTVTCDIDRTTDLRAINLSAVWTQDGLQLTATGSDPQLTNFDSILRTDELCKYQMMEITYNSTSPGTMEMFYSNSEQSFSQEKSTQIEIAQGDGVAKFNLPLSEYSHMRMDIPDEGSILIKEVRLYKATPLDYGYDSHYFVSGNSYYLDESNSMHIYPLKHLPRLWGELDSQAAAQNQVIADIVDQGDFFKIVSTNQLNFSDGCYLRVDADCSLTDPAATIRLGSMQGNIFVEKMRYSFYLQAGSHTYLIRVSSDYNWHDGTIDTILFNSENEIADVRMCLLAGD